MVGVRMVVGLLDEEAEGLFKEVVRVEDGQLNAGQVVLLIVALIVGQVVHIDHDRGTELDGLLDVASYALNSVERHVPVIRFRGRVGASFVNI